MKCCICGKELKDFGNNPYPLCAESDRDSRCCDECNLEFVTKARIYSMNKIDINTKLPDSKLEELLRDKLIIIFYSKNSTLPIEAMNNEGKFLGGTIDLDEFSVIDGEAFGTWGNFGLDLKNDSYIVVNK